MSITKKKMKGPEWLFVYPLAVRTFGKQRERLSRGHKFCRCACHVTQTGPKHLFTCRHCQFKALLVSYSAKVILTKTLEHTVFQGTMFAVNITNTWNLA